MLQCIYRWSAPWIIWVTHRRLYREEFTYSDLNKNKNVTSMSLVSDLPFTPAPEVEGTALVPGVTGSSLSSSLVVERNRSDNQVRIRIFYNIQYTLYFGPLQVMKWYMSMKLQIKGVVVSIVSLMCCCFLVVFIYYLFTELLFFVPNVILWYLLDPVIFSVKFVVFKTGF